MTNITNDEDIIDSREVIARIEQLQALRTPGPVPEGILDPEDYTTDQDSLFAELRALTALAAEGENASDWQFGATLVRDSYFTEYARELAEDIGAYNSNNSWPYNCIDWEKASSELKMDYSAVDFDGVTYWVR